MRVLTLGTFGIPHLGHAAFFRACERLGDLTVGVNSDRFVQQYRGELPLYNESERLAIIAALGYPVVLNDGPGRDVLEQLRPDIVVVGTDWARRDYLVQLDVDQDFLDERGISVCYIPMRPVGISSTDLVARIRGG